MKSVRQFIQNHPLIFSLLAGLFFIVASSFVIIASLQFWPEELFYFENPAPNTLDENSDIKGWMTYDKASYHQGETISVDITVQYRADKIEPDFESLDNSINFFPFDEQLLGSRLNQIDDEISEYIIEYSLQAVRTDPSSRYSFSPFSLYYRLTDSSDSNSYLLQIPPPPVYVASYYPEDISAVPFQALRGKIYTVDTLRYSLMLISSTGLFLLALFILVRFGRKRKIKELTIPERLWRELYELDDKSQTNRTRLLSYEKIFTQLLQFRTGMSPELFWSGTDPGDDLLTPVFTKAREILSGNYSSYMSENEAVSEMRSILADILSNIVEEYRLQIEQGPTFYDRIMKDRRVPSSAFILLLLSVIIFTLAIFPQTWISPEISRYNIAVDNASSGGPDFYLEFLALGDELQIDKVKSASLYNAGTGRADRAFYDASPDQRRVTLPAIFQTDTAEEFMHTLIDGPFLEEQDVVTLLLNAEEYHRRAQLDLQAASRISPDDEDIGRNLELVTRRYNGILLKLKQIRTLYEETSEEEDEAISDQGIVDLLNAELPDEDEDESVRRDDRGYLILERF